MLLASKGESHQKAERFAIVVKETQRGQDMVKRWEFKHKRPRTIANLSINGRVLKRGYRGRTFLRRDIHIRVFTFP